jgi:hypothetical protein
MKDVKVLRKHAQEILDHVSSANGDEAMDVTGKESGFTDYNFDILRQHYAGTDFETEANSLCDILSSIHSKMGDVRKAGPVFMKLRMALKGDDGNLFPGFEPYEDFVSKLMDMMESVAVNKSNITPGMDPVPMQTEQQQTNEEMKEMPNIKSAEAKMLELEQYLQGIGLDKRQKWQDYLGQARQLAAVGDDSFDAKPQLGPEDMVYLKESERQKMTRDSQKQAMLQQLVGVNRAGPGI